jgi:cytochrome c oxidase subunit 2
MAGLLWLALTLVMEVLVAIWDFQPLAAAKEARVVDGAFLVLFLLAIPVVTFVFVALIYSVLRFRRRGGQSEDGPPIRSSGRVLGAWFLATTALTILVIIFPGTTGLLELRSLAREEADLVVQVEGIRWAWKMTYPQQGVTSYSELVLPVGQRVRFEVTSVDVIHAFWVPAFRMKVDAIPGRVTTIHATPNRAGSLQRESGFRLQCAELCGIGHAVMMVPARVVELAEFEAWVAQQVPGS